MNLVQAQVGHKVAAHFRRERRLMPRNYPVAILNDDQETLVADLVDVFKHQNNLFDEKAFREVCFNAD